VENRLDADFTGPVSRIDITARYLILTTQRSNPGAVQVFGCGLECGREVILTSRLLTLKSNFLSIDEKLGRMGFRTRSNHQNLAVRRLRRENYSNGGGIWVGLESI